MNNDLKEQDMAYGGDPMFDDILRDLLALNQTIDEESALNNSQTEKTTSS
jgi:hypothetical protein